MTSRLLEDVIFCLFALDLHLVGVMRDSLTRRLDCQVYGFKRGLVGGLLNSFCGGCYSSSPTDLAKSCKMYLCCYFLHRVTFSQIACKPALALF